MFPLSPVLHHDLPESDSDDDSPPLHFSVANPDTDNRNDQPTNDAPLPVEQVHATVTPPQPSTQGHGQQCHQSEDERRVVKDLPPIVVSTASLERRQSKTLQDDMEMQQSPFYSISDTVEYQPHHLRASILEPLSNTASHTHSQSPPLQPPSKEPAPLPTTPTTKTAPSGNPISYSLVHNPGAIKLYRDMAEKTQDEKIQLNYAKYLLEAAGTDLLSHKQKNALQDEGLRWIRRLSKKGVGEAALMEAMWMEIGHFGYKSHHGSRIDRLYHIAIQAGVPLASYQLALRKETMAAQTVHPYDIFRLYQKAADLNCVEALYVSVSEGDWGKGQALTALLVAILENGQNLLVW